MIKTKWLAFTLILLAFACRDKYVIPNVSSAKGYLVVEGNINAGNDTSVLVLSRTAALTTGTRQYEERATVFVEGKDGAVFNFRQTGAGEYSINSLNIDNSKTYRLHIKTSDGKDYVSDYVAVKTTPPVDSVSWKREPDGVRIYINAHDATANTKYYQWNYQETWEIHSPYLSVLEWDLTSPGNPKVKLIDPATGSYVKERYACWVNRNSNTLNLGSTAKLSEDRVYLPLLLIPNAARQLTVLYSVMVNQYALSKEAYDYLDNMRRNTESTGSIFDPQPSTLIGNIHASADATEPVIGYVNISTLQRKRLWIKYDEVRNWAYNSLCNEVEIPNIPDSVKEAYNGGLIPTVIGKPPGITTFFATGERKCMDCTVVGSKIKPSFWP